MKSVLFTVGLMLGSWSHAALYEVELGGQTSHLLGLHPGLARTEVQETVGPRLARSCALLLLSDPLRPARTVPFPPNLRTAYPLRLSPEAAQVVRELVHYDAEDFTTVTSLAPGAALQLLRVQFHDERERRLDGYARAVRDGRLPDGVQLSAHPGLAKVARALFGPGVDLATLARRAVRRLEDEGAGQVGQDLELFLRRVHGPRPVIELEPVIDVPALARKVTPAQLDVALLAMGDVLFRNDLKWFYTHVLVNDLADEVRRRYLELPAAEYAHLNYLLQLILPAAGLYLPGEEDRRHATVNRHRAWIEPIAAALADGGAFVALPAQHVVPELDGWVDGTIVDDLVARGARVTPVPLTQGGAASAGTSPPDPR